MPGKLGLHLFYSKDPHIRAYLPPTAVLNRDSFYRLMRRYKSVYIKPNMSHMGKGIMKAWSIDKEYRFVKVKGDVKSFRNLKSAYNTIQKQTSKDLYIVQKTIHLAKIKTRPFDIRVMMMRNSQNNWQYTGMLAKVAGRSSVITNVNRGGGYVIPIEHALDTSLRLTHEQQHRTIKDLIDLSHRICHRFNRYKYSSQIGIDFGIDQHHKIWIIEVNFDYPSHDLFNKLKDKKMYRKIKSLRNMYLKALQAGKIRRK
ncbi:YheC/YheD family protein [Paenibacillus chondroitinus]|uniref:YheC/YheD family protein n=1 Tax=Paenibacillus chondroitinus TaxID=59842 RepID=A0ABU6DG10_9BACL|nr:MULTISPECIES: YheC/YheD family protein [Paenibacillus]MCY9662669.1 YheC/YheD family protein [Paenibacillus anseongense]MEB4796706.1 YheC/YheD family protein [Paenibacillus chondroitinus]